MRILQRSILLLTLLTTPGHANDGKAKDEYAVKAALVYNISRFVQWPASDPVTPFDICVLGRDRYGTNIDAVATRRTHDRTIRIARYGKLDEAQRCDIAIIGRSETFKASEAINHFAGQATLTIGDDEQFVDIGGGIRLLTSGETVAFEINLGSARNVGLDVSSHLLQVARRVVDKSDKKERK